VLSGLNENNIDHAVEIIQLVQQVRGYGHVKAANYKQYKLRLTQQLKRYNNGDVELFEIPVMNVA
jgi:hypothetical protein